MDDQPQGNKRILITFLAVTIIAVVVIAGVMMAQSDKKADETADTTDTVTTSSSEGTVESVAPSTTSEATTDTTAGSSAYKDGEYTATGSYSSPGGTERITISVTLDDGVVTATSATSGATDRDSKEYQSQFIANYKTSVVGKAIESISLNRVSGSSLTSQGFNAALDKIKTQAKA